MHKHSPYPSQHYLTDTDRKIGTHSEATFNQCQQPFVSVHTFTHNIRITSITTTQKRIDTTAIGKFNTSSTTITNTHPSIHPSTHLCLRCPHHPDAKMKPGDCPVRTLVGSTNESNTRPIRFFQLPLCLGADQTSTSDMTIRTTAANTAYADNARNSCSAISESNNSCG